MNQVYMKKRKEGSASIPDASISREHDEGFDILDSIAEDMKAGMFKEALQSLCDHIMSLDREQDKHNKE